MKIACQSCQAKYTIADEKVLGRVVKIRCKKCSATIVINGNEVNDATANVGGVGNEDPTAVAPASQAGGYDYAAQQGEEWTVNVSDGDQRTMRTAEIVAQFKAGVINDETYCWKDGMNDWLPVREISELAAQCAPNQLQSPPQASAYGAPQPTAAAGAGLGALFGGGGGTPFPAAAAAPDANGGGVFGVANGPAARRAGGRAAQGGDLFGNVADAGGENDVMTSAPQGVPQAHEGGDKLTGQRNENSVLFSLSALTQNSPGPASVPAPQGDGSGLIDIRALASTMSPNKEKQTNHIDDIMNLGGGGAFSAALAAPVLAPATMDGNDVVGGYPAPSSNNKFLLIGVAALAGVLLLLVVVLLMRKPTPVAAEATSPVASVASATPAGQAAPAADTASAPPIAATAPTPGIAAVPATAAANDTTPSSGSTRHHASGGGSSATNSGGGGSAAVAAVPAPAPPPASFDQAIAKAAGNSGGGGGGGGGAAAAESSAPFDRGAAAGALGAVNVQSCKKNDGPTGQGHVQVTFSPSGGVQSAVADTPPFAGTAVGGCVAGKFRSAHVPPFGGGTVKVGKSFVIN
jgi:predicted Zn finger-like uncharacterized protein